MTLYPKLKEKKQFPLLTSNWLNFIKLILKMLERQEQVLFWTSPSSSEAYYWRCLWSVGRVTKTYGCTEMMVFLIWVYWWVEALSFFLPFCMWGIFWGHHSLLLYVHPMLVFYTPKPIYLLLFVFLLLIKFYCLSSKKN